MWLEEKLWVPIEAFRQTPNIEHLTAEIMIQTCRETVHQIILLSKIKKKNPMLSFVKFVKYNRGFTYYISQYLQHRCFPVKSARFLRTPILKNIRERVVLHLDIKLICQMFLIFNPYQANVTHMWKPVN